jgi:hypothetical protein
LAAIVLAAPAGATTINDLSVRNCMRTNCSTESISGSIGNQSGVFPFPWEIQVGSEVGNCLRLETTFADVDLEIVAVSPSGAVYRDDDGGAGDLSLVKIAPAERGWYTVQVSTFDGAAVSANFTLLYGRYASASNPNCQPPTPPAARAVAKKK